MNQKLTNREAYHLAQILAKEQEINKFVSYLKNEIAVLNLEKQTILKVYGLPVDKEINFNENSNEITFKGVEDG